MKPQEYKVGDRIQWLTNPLIKSKVKEIKPSIFTQNEWIYVMENGCQFREYEMMKID